MLRALIVRPQTVDGLRSSVNGLLPAVYASLDLCLACKGCTSECPSGVDMPKLKYEFMNEYYKTHSRPLRDYLFGYFHLVSKLLAPFAPLANSFMQMGWSKKLIAQVMGITDKRPFPVFARSKQGNRHTGQQDLQKTVIFLSDVFSRYLEPEVEQAAFDILQAYGYNVKVLPIVGAGASLLSKGFIDAARRHAEKVLAEIKHLEAGSSLSVVGCEPPEIYCLKHEYVSLMPNRRAEIESITKRVWLVEEFILRVATVESGSLLPKLQEQAPALQKVTLHPHCHQRAERLADDGLPTGTAATTALLREFGFDVDVIDAGCCGMAGTFGYDAEHYDLSMQVGELGVLPKVRAAGQVVSTGSACRMQIRQGAGKETEHPLVLMAKRLKK